MVAPLVLGGIALGTALAGAAASQNKNKTPTRQLVTYAGPRAAQEGLLEMSMRQAQGLGPSFADLQMRQGQEAARQQASSMAASAYGSQNAALAQRTATNTAAAQSANVAGEAVQARVNEIIAARTLAAQQSGQLRGMDLQQEQINLQARLAKDQAEAARKEANRQRVMSAFMFGAASIGAAGMQKPGMAGQPIDMQQIAMQQMPTNRGY